MFPERREVEREPIRNCAKDAVDVASIAVPRTKEACTKEPALVPPVRDSKSDRRLSVTSGRMEPKDW